MELWSRLGSASGGGFVTASFVSLLRISSFDGLCLACCLLCLSAVGVVDVCLPWLNVWVDCL